MSGVRIPEDGAEACLSAALARAEIALSGRLGHRERLRECKRDFASDGEVRVGGRETEGLEFQTLGFPGSSAAPPAGVRTPRHNGVWGY